MTPPFELREIHRQRMREAVSKAKAGHRIVFAVDRGAEPPTVVWRSLREPRQPHVVLNSWGFIEEWKAAVEEEFAALVRAASEAP